MKLVLPVLMLGAALAVSACSGPGAVGSDASLAPSGQQTGPEARAARTSVAAADWRLSQLVINVPRSLTVSEENTIKPRADIVWREDPPGDRYAQVAAVMQRPLQQSLSQMNGTTPVTVELTVTRFHALTERTRASIGGEHEIEFVLIVRDAATGTVLRGPEPTDLTFDAFGGAAAAASEAQGVFQRDRIHTRLREWAMREFGVLP